MKHLQMGLKMHIKKGEIYLADLGSIKNEDIGKVRPVLIFQNNFLNRMLSDSKFQDVIVIPLSSKIVENDFAFLLKKRDNLKKDSIILCNSIKMINAKRLQIDKGIMAQLTHNEMQSIEDILYNLFGCQNR